MASDWAQHWDRLNAQRGDLPFLGAYAITSALEAFGTGQERLLCGHAGGDLVAMFLLAPCGLARWQTFQPSQIPLGAWVAAPGLAIEQLARSLIKGPLRTCLALSITQLDPRFSPRAPDTAAGASGDYIETGWIDIDGSFQAYWEARGKNLRQNLRKQRNKLAAEGVALEMRVLQAVGDVAPALARYGRLESSGWKASQGTAIHPDNQQGRFYQALFEHAARQGEALIYEYTFDGKPVAMDLCLLRQGQLIVLKTTYDEAIKSFSPAFLLREEELQHYFSGQQIKRIEYYGRLMEWHTRWTDQKRTLYHLTCYRYGWLKSLATKYRQRLAARQSAAAQPVPTEVS
nr:GNAT family N-acetyltransferase [uncultured Roseateles sp.]